VAHRVNGFFQRPDIGFDPEVAFSSGRVLPADGEDLQVALKAIANDALFRHEIENVELIDLRRGGEQRPLVHLCSRRSVLDQPHTRRAREDRAGVVARFLPTAKVRVSTCAGKPPLCTRSPTKFSRPYARLAPPVSRSFFNAAGLLASALVGAIASTM